jgi:hypothetical protein
MILPPESKPATYSLLAQVFDFNFDVGTVVKHLAAPEPMPLMASPEEQIMRESAPAIIEGSKHSVPAALQ